MYFTFFFGSSSARAALVTKTKKISAKDSNAANCVQSSSSNLLNIIL